MENEKITMKTEQENINTIQKQKKVRTRTCIVLIILAVFILSSLITYRAEYLEALEIGEEYIQVFTQNIKYKINIGAINFIVVFLAVYIINKFIKKGLKQFFDEEKKEIPKLPNKSLALIIALVTSVIISNMFLQKVILFANVAWFGNADPIYNMDMGFYMFQMPLIRTTIILCSYSFNNINNIYSRILFNSI